MKLSKTSLKSNFKKLYNRFKFFRKADHKVILSKNTRIQKNAIVEVRYGGSIFIGSNSEILDGVLILTYGGNIIIGDNCSINAYTIIYGHGGTKIGNNVLIAGHCMIIPSNHNFINRDLTIIEQGNTSLGINIDDDVWIGHGCTILDGVRIGRGSIIAAGSVVNKNVEPFSVMAGVPAKMIKKR